MRSLGSALNMELRGVGHFRLRCRLFARLAGSAHLEFWGQSKSDCQIILESVQDRAISTQ